MHQKGRESYGNLLCEISPDTDISNSNDCYTVRERTMIALMNELTDMPGWERQIFDAQFTFTWKSAKVMAGKDVTRCMADWVSVFSFPEDYRD